MTAWLAQFHFLRPLWLLALPLVALMAWLNLRGRDPARAFGDLIAPHLLSHLVVAPDTNRRLSPELLLLALAVLTCIALAGPSWRKEPSPFAEETAVMMVVMRVAPSMESTDLKPSRLERARNKLHDLLALRAGARTGLIAYAGSAHLVVPATADARLVEQMAAALDPTVMPEDGDALVQALGLAQSQIDRAEGAGSVVVIADGVAPAQRERLPGLESSPPIQFLATVANAETASQTGISEAAQALGAHMTLVTPNDADIRSLNSRALSAAAAAASEGERWRDDGWLLMPVIAFGTIMWGVRGWSVRWA